MKKSLGILTETISHRFIIEHDELSYDELGDVAYLCYEYSNIVFDKDGTYNPQTLTDLLETEKHYEKSHMITDKIKSITLGGSESQEWETESMDLN